MIRMFTTQIIDVLFEQLSTEVKTPTTLVVCGGVSMVLNYESRLATRDIDCVLMENHVKCAAEVIAESLDLDCDWLNDNVCVTQSYSSKLLKYKKLYNRFGNLSVYTISGIPLLCMKLISWRPNSSDYEDCLHILHSLGDSVRLSDVYAVMNECYGGTSLLSVDADNFLKYELCESTYTLDEESVQSYLYLIKSGVQDIDDLPEEIQTQLRARL